MLRSASMNLPEHRNALILPIKTQKEREGGRVREGGGREGGEGEWAVPLSVRASSWERFALPHRTPCKPPCRRSQEAALCVGAGRRDSRIHGFYPPSAGKMVFLLRMVALYTLSVFSGASAAAHREYLSPVCCSAHTGSRSTSDPSSFFRCFYA